MFSEMQQARNELEERRRRTELRIGYGNARSAMNMRGSRQTVKIQTPSTDIVMRHRTHTNDVPTNSIMDDNSDIEELEAHTWDEETVKTFNESCQQLNETVTNLKSINEQIEL
ncbi:Hypothetical predicted protein [Drosophila guanche]|uniref:Uncharacterized protein n=1 Tax=Drosophila guanche TaxID=7266 RepID=A0A3B0K3R9_DROGU|nr:Hypothetical predicted protein [Drosophila guanche]